MAKTRKGTQGKSGKSGKSKEPTKTKKSRSPRVVPIIDSPQVESQLSEEINSAVQQIQHESHPPPSSSSSINDEPIEELPIAQREDESTTGKDDNLANDGN